MTPRGSRAAMVPAEDMEDADPGLARERTGMAWTRTAISFAALGSALLKTTPLAGAVILAMSALVWGLGRLSQRHERLTNRHRNRLLLLITLAVIMVSLLALALALLAGRTGCLVQSCGSPPWPGRPGRAATAHIAAQPLPHRFFTAAS
jgi:uncharacterized membrane protein YidH (DUF202 family)